MVRILPATHRAFLAGALILTSCGGDTTSSPADDEATDSPPPATGGEDLASVCEITAAEEGQVEVWIIFENQGPILDAFTDAYPGIEANPLSVRTEDFVQRLLTEAAAGTDISADVIAGQMESILPLIERGLVADSVQWDSFGVPEDVINPNSNGLVRIDRVANGLAYNTDNVTPDELPSTWDGLIDERWEGDVIQDPRGRPFDTLALEWGRERTLEFAQEFQDITQPLLIEGGTAGITAVAGGQARISTGGRSEAIPQLRAEGAPVDIHYMDLIPVFDSNMGIMEDAPHPNAARCFAGWLATEGAEIYQEVEFKSNEAIPPGAPADSQLLTIETPEDAALVRDMGEELGQLWAGQ